MNTPALNLTPRQSNALRLCAEGLTRKQIASEMGVSCKTVEYYFDGAHDTAGIHQKIGTNSVALLTQWALKHGIAQWKVV